MQHWELKGRGEIVCLFWKDAQVGAGVSLRNHAVGRIKSYTERKLEKGERKCWKNLEFHFFSFLLFLTSWVKYSTQGIGSFLMVSLFKNEPPSFLGAAFVNEQLFFSLNFPRKNLIILVNGFPFLLSTKVHWISLIGYAFGYVCGHLYSSALDSRSYEQKENNNNKSKGPSETHSKHKTRPLYLR